MRIIRAMLEILLLVGLGSAQQFPLLHTPYQNMGLLSQSCYEALNLTVDCADQLANHHRYNAISVDILNATDVEAVCTEACKESLISLRGKIVEECQGNDVLTYRDTNYPASYVVDRYLYFYNTSCYKDRDTGKFCDLKLSDWRETNTSADSHNCDDCILGPLQAQINSPIGHLDARGDDMVSRFRDLVSSCSATGYSYTTPGPYGWPAPTTAAIGDSMNTTFGRLNSTATASSSGSSPSCASGRTYVVQLEDTCNSISAEHNVATFDLIQVNNNLDIWCKLLKPGRTICIPQRTCVTHRVTYGDTCWTLGKDYGTTEQQIIDWNANINRRCTNLTGWRLTYVCVGVNNGTSTRE